MFRILRIDLRYHRLHLLIVTGAALFFGFLFKIFEPPSWDKAFGILFIPSMLIIGAYAITRANENRDYVLLNLPISHLDVYLARQVFLIATLMLPYLIALVAYALRGDALEALFQLVIPAFTKGWLLINVFLLQLDLKTKQFNTIAKTIISGFLSVLQVLILWGMFFYYGMADLITELGGGLFVDLTMTPIHQLANDLYILVAAIIIALIHFYIFTLERHPQNSRCL